MPLYESSSSDHSDDENQECDNTPPNRKLLRSRQGPIHALLGHGKVADVLLWRDKKVSTTLLVGVTIIWFLFEVVEYSLVTLLSHIAITSMLLLFIWTSAARHFNLPPPQAPDMLLPEPVVREFMPTIHRRLNIFINKALDVAYGTDPLLFIFATLILYILSVIGSYISFVNLMFLSFVFLETVPFMYERYEDEVDHMGGKLGRDVKRMWKWLDARVLDKIPRGPVYDKNN